MSFKNGVSTKAFRILPEDCFVELCGDMAKISAIP